MASIQFTNCHLTNVRKDYSTTFAHRVDIQSGRTCNQIRIAAKLRVTALQYGRILHQLLGIGRLLLEMILEHLACN